MSQLLHVCHSVSPSVCLSLSLSLTPRSLSLQVMPSPVDRAGVEKATERNTGNEQFDEATTYSTTVGPTPYLVLFCGCRVGTLLWGTEQCDWCNCFAALLQVTETLERNPDTLFTAFMKTWPPGTQTVTELLVACVWKSVLLIHANVPTRIKKKTARQN